MDNIRITGDDSLAVEVTKNRIMAVLLTDDDLTQELIEAIANKVVEKIKKDPSIALGPINKENQNDSPKNLNNIS